MYISTNRILQVLLVITWIIFVGLGIEAGRIITTALGTLFLGPVRAEMFWQPVDLSALYEHDRGYFYVVMFIMSLVVIMKALLFYLIIRLLHNKTISFSKPFNNVVLRFIFSIGYLAFGIGLFSIWGSRYSEWFVKQGVKMPDIEYLGLGGGDVWLFMSVTLFVIGQIFKKGIEIQTENELTV